MLFTVQVDQVGYNPPAFKQKVLLNHVSALWKSQKVHVLDIFHFKIYKSKTMTGEVSFEMAEALDLKRAIWKKRIEGLSVSEISGQVGLDEKHVVNLLNEAYAERQEQLDDLVAREKLMDLERLDELMRQYFKVAKMDHVIVEMMQEGIAINGLCFDRPAKAALVFLQIIEKKAKILGYEPETKKGVKPLDQGWVQKRSAEVKALLN